MLTIRQDAHLGVKQQQRLLLSFAMQQAIQVLQMPQLELSEWLKAEIEENPILEYEEEITYSSSSSSFSSSRIEKALQEPDIAAPISLFDHLMNQARLSSFNAEELEMAEFLIGSLDERGFLESQDISPSMKGVLLKLQEFDPPGIAARSLPESLLLQLRLKGKENSLASRVLESHFEDLLHNRFPLIAKKLKCSVVELQEAIEKEMAPLNLRPAAPFFTEQACVIIPDLILKKEDETWTIEMNEDLMPKFQIREKANVNKRHFQNAKWLKNALESRQKTLFGICRYLVKKQDAYLNGDSEALEPMTMQEVAETLGLHISTIGRAVNGKHLFCPKGLVAMRSLFCYDLGNATSNQSAKQLLLDLIGKEDKRHPLSDDALALKISALGIPLARRTIAKYRKLSHIPSASQRREWI